MDSKTSHQRSKNMAAIRSSDTGPELLLRRTLWRLGTRYFTAAGWERLTTQKLPGKPDLVLPAAKLVIFVDGCFWHGCAQHYRAPENNRECWKDKLICNQSRDQKVNQALEASGWRVMRFWEHELRNGGHNLVAQTVLQTIDGHRLRKTPDDLK